MIAYCTFSDGKVYETDNLHADKIEWRLVTDEIELLTMNQHHPIDLEEIYPVFLSAREAWESE